MLNRTLLLGIFLSVTSQLATADKLEKPFLGDLFVRVSQNVGVLRIATSASDQPGEFRIAISTSFDSPLQTFSVSSSLTSSWNISLLSAYDVDGDGYTDLVVNNGYGSGPIPMTQLFRYDSTSGMFIEDTSFPNYDYPTPSQRRGCIYLNERLWPSLTYETTEWCLDRQTNSWKIRRQCAQTTEPKCYSEIQRFKHRRSGAKKP